VTFKDYAAHGWKLCAIEVSQKGPTYAQWNTRPIAADAVDGLDGAGLLHALSGTCALDIDHMELARPWLAERGVDVDGLLSADTAVRIESGRPGRAKLLYRLSKPLRTIKPKGSGLELRCATANGQSVQDVLPPSIHPETKKPYRWACGILGDWRNLPPIPVGLLAVWRETAESNEPSPVIEAPTEPRIDLVKLRKAAFKHSPDCEYDEWIKVGMQLNDGTGGAHEGFDIWCEWSRGMKRKPYPGDVTLKSHWLSFKSEPGKRVASGAALVNELPAEAEEFPLETVLSDEEEAVIKAEAASQAKAAAKTALEALEKRLVFVHSAERYFDLERHKIIGSDNVLEHMFTASMPVKKGARMSPVKALKASATKRFVDALGFHPGEGAIFKDHVGDTFANSYKPQIPTPLEPTALEREKVEWLFARIDEPHYRKWLMQFFAHVVQRPGVKIKSAPLIWSEIQGNGKTTLLRMIPMLLTGPRYSREVTCALLNSDFNDYLLNAWHVNLTEFRAGSRGDRTAITQKLRAWITDDTISIHPKGFAAYNMPNHFFTTATSNEDDAAAIDNNDRRWGIHEMHARQFTEEEQSWVYDEFLLTARAPGVLRTYFLGIDLSGFSASAKAPETAARAEMVEASASADFELLRTAFEQNAHPLNRDVVIAQDVVDYVHKHCVARPSAHRIGRMLCRPPFNGHAIQFRANSGKYRGVILKNRERWEGRPGNDILAHISGEDVDLAS
jgi:hypothetical protein